MSPAKSGNSLKQGYLGNKLPAKCYYNFANRSTRKIQCFLGNNESAMNDLNKAIELSNGKGFAASQAYMQRGLLNKMNSDTENAIEDLRKASKLGNVFAKQLLVDMNPYAALCNKMLSEVFAKEFNPEVCQ